MDKLEAIMDRFTDIEFGIESLLITLEVLSFISYDAVENVGIK